jgi:DNA repair protein RecN (Recombination protein N)
VEGDPERLAEVEDRLAGLRALARKHGGSLAAALARRDEMRAELARTSGAGERAAELERLVAEQAALAVAAAEVLGAARRGAARSFQKAVVRELEPLAMARCRVEVAFSAPEGALEVAGVRLAAAGGETAEIRIAPNPGEPARPLARVASGGELSRLLLAVKRALSGADPVSCYVFDEVDAGIGGAVAEAVGRALEGVARERQVICVTHLPQVAAFADRHLRVEKRVQGGRTAVAVEPLEGADERRAEVARMLAGQTVTASALEHAASLIAQARRDPARPGGPARRARVAPSGRAREAARA